jgi:hypothetical protein
MPTPSGRHSWLLRRQSGGSRAIFASMGISLNVPNERISGSQDVGCCLPRCRQINRARERAVPQVASGGWRECGRLGLIL